MPKEAERYYHDIYASLGSKSDVLPEQTVEAVQWLMDFYKRESRWKDAKPVYPKLWQTIVVRAKQYGLSADFISRFYTAYVYALKTKYEASAETIQQVTVQFREVSMAVLGEDHEITIKATYELATIYEQNEKTQEEAVQLYNWVISHVEKKASSTALSSQLLTVLRDTKKQVARLYSASTTTTSKAVTLLVNEYQTRISELGYSHKSTLEQQQQLVTTLAKENSSESRTRLTQLLETSALNVLSSEKDSKKLTESATQIAKLYLTTGQVETANALLIKLRRQIIFDEYNKSSKTKHQTTNHDSVAFVTAFELSIHPERRFSEVMSELMTERMRYETYHKAVTEKSNLMVVVARGKQLLEYLQNLQREEEYTYVRKDLFKVFRGYLNVQTKDEAFQSFVEIVIAHVGHVEDKSTILQEVVSRVSTCMNQSKFREAYELALLEIAFIEIQRDELSTAESLGLGLKLALLLAGRSSAKTEDADLAVQMLNLSKKVLNLVLVAAHRQGISLSTMALEEVNSLAGLLGQLEMYTELETVLADLWTSRHVQQTWSPATIISLGKRLIEVRFTAGHTEAAVHLCGDIIYNLRRVWGEMDATTLEFWTLLGQLHSTAGDFKAAQDVHEEVLRQTIAAVEDGDVTADKGASIAVAHLDLLKTAYGGSSGWSRDVKTYSNLQGQLRNEFGKESAWNKSANAKQDVSKWTKEASSKSGALWKKPTSWEFFHVDASGAHRNNLRKISGLFAADVNGGGPRGHKSYGQDIQSQRVTVKHS